MTVDGKDGKLRIPIRFGAPARETEAESDPVGASADESVDLDADDDVEHFISDEGFTDLKSLEEELFREEARQTGSLIGPQDKSELAPAELIVARAELKKREAEAEELRDKLARRQADF